MAHRITNSEFLARYIGKAFEFLEENYITLAFIQALLAVSGSLYFSLIAGLPACELCWYQRTLIFPTVIILGSALFLRKEEVADYIIPLMVVGIPIAAYHYFIQFTQASYGCSTEVSCSTKQVHEFGYISVPMMSLTFFVNSILLMLFEYRE